MEDMLASNKHFQAEKLRKNPNYFETVPNYRDHKVLWIGCSDWRASPEVITKSDLGEIFTLRNIAGCVNEDDFSAKSVIQLSIQLTNVEEIMVVDHTDCGGIMSALNFEHLTGDIVEYIKPVREVYLKNRDEIDSLKSHDLKNAALSKLNVKRNVENVKSLGCVQEAIQGGRNIKIHGFLYNLKNGLLERL